MEGNGLDIKKMLAMLAQSKAQVKPLENVTIKIIDLPYITKERKVSKRKLRLYTPNDAIKPMPLIFVPHYEMPEDALEMREYLKEGWAVASCAEFNGGEYNKTITDDDLVFNNAMLYYLRNLDEIDSERIAVVGGSAGGYMTLMLNALQSGICCAVANGPITNFYFNFKYYFPKANAYNLKAIMAMTEEERKDVVTMLSKLPIPFVGAIGGGAGFTAALENFPDENEVERWEAFSPTAICEAFGNPIYITSCTSDILVPVDQITRRFTYKENGESLPKGFDCTLPDNLFGKLKYSLEERLPSDQVNVFLRKVMTDGSDTVYEFDDTKRFQIFITDEGAPESYCSHNKGINTGKAIDVPYIKAMFDKKASKTNVITVEKVIMLVKRYNGESIQLPAIEGVDDTVYGSFAIYKKEVLQHFKKWKNDSANELDFALENVRETNLDLVKTIDEIIENI